MSSFSGFVRAALQLGLQSFLIRPTRGIYGIQQSDGSTLPDILAQAVIEEHHTDQLEITDHPVEQGASITDHAFKRPAEVTLRLGWSNSPSGASSLVNAAIGAVTAANPTARAVANVVGVVSAASSIQSMLSGADPSQINAIYQQLLRLQETRALFVLYTGKRVYTNMVCKTLVTETDHKTANALIITMTCQQVILVNTQTVALPKNLQKQPELTASQTDKGQVNAQPSNFSP